MAHGHSDPHVTRDPGRSLCQVDVGEPIDVRMGTVASLADVEPLLAASGPPVRGADFILVLVLPGEIAPEKAIGPLKWFEDVGHTLVLTWSDPPLGRAATPAAARSSVKTGSGCRVLIVPDAEWAVAGGLQCVHAGDAFWVVAVGVGHPGMTALRAAIVRGIAWRAAWDEPENGEFHTSARGPDGAPVLPGELADDAQGGVS